jgi:hypothetical protein
MGTIYKDYTDKPLADLNLDYHKIKNLTQTEYTLHQTCIYNHMKSFALRYNSNNNTQGAGLGAKAHNPPDPH